MLITFDVMSVFLHDLHSSQLVAVKTGFRDFGNNEINKSLKVREFKVHGQEKNIYRVCCETCYQYHFEIQI